MSVSDNQVSESGFLRILYDFSASLIQIRDEDELIWHVARQVVGQLGFVDCVVYLLDEDTNMLVQHAAIGEKNPQAFEIVNRLVIPVGRGVTGRVAQTAQSVLLSDTSKTEDYIADTIEGTSELCVPILFEGRVLGVIDSEDPRPGFYNEQHLRFLESVASLLGAKIQQLRLTREVHRAERERAALMEIASLQTRASDPREYFDQLRKTVARQIPFDRMQVGVHSKGDRTIHLPFTWDEGEVSWDKAQALVGESPMSVTEWLLNTDTPSFLFEDEFIRMREAGTLGDTENVPAAVIGVPFTIDNASTGLLAVSCFDPRLNLTPEDLDFLVLVANYVADALRFNRSRIEQEAAQARLAESESQLRSIIDNAPIAVSLKTPDGRFLAVGKEFCRINNVSEDELIGQFDLPDVVPHIAETVRLLEEEVRTKKTIARREVEQPGRSGRQRYTVLTKFPILDDAGELVAIGGIGADVTEQRYTEKQLVQSQRLEVVGQLTGGIAHDFNNLLMAISGGVERAQDIASDIEELQPVLELIRKGADRGAELTKRLSVFSRMQIFDLQPSDIDELVDQAVKLIRHALGAGVDLNIDHSPDTWTARTDQGFFEHALLNLAINARDAMPDGGRLSIQTSNISFDTQAARAFDAEPGDYVEISVADNGSGMSPQVRSKVFEPFFTTKEIGRGSGLGLSMVFGFAQQCGGFVNIDSHPGLGTTVRLYLPRSHEAPVDQAAEVTSKHAMLGPPARVLVVEDDQSIRAILQQFLSDFGHEAVIVEDGPSALDRASKDPHNFDLLITDIALPEGMDGRQVAREFLKANDGGKVLYISGYAQDSIVNEGRLDDGHEFLAKPFSRKSLASKIDEALKRTSN